MKQDSIPSFIVDTREQNPYQFEGNAISRKLDTGDYSLDGLESVAAVERKELSDFIGCCTFGRGRFERELSRACSMRRLWVVIEGNFSQIAGHQYRSEANPESVIGSIAAWECRFDPVRFVFASNRQSGQRITAKLLTRAWKEYQEPSSRTVSAVVE